MRIAGITIPEKKRLEFGLTAVYGIGRPRAQSILEGAGIDLGKRPAELSPSEEQNIRQAIEQHRVEGELKREISGNIKRLKDIKCYRGVRHAKRLPVRGQHTKTNARTLKGAKKTMGSGRRKLDKK